MAKVFLSHSSTDKEIVRKVGEALKELGHEVWLDEWEIKVGESIVARVEKGLAESDCVVLIMSKAAVSSGWVEKEWQSKYGAGIKSRNLTVLPVLLEKDCPIPFLLQGIKYADLSVGFQRAVFDLETGISNAFPARANKAAAELVKPSDHSSELQALIRKACDSSIPLSSILPEVLVYATKLSLPDLAEVVKVHMNGPAKGIAKGKGKDLPDYLRARSHKVYVYTKGDINPDYVGWNGSAARMFQFLEQSEDTRWWQLVFPNSISDLEMRTKNYRASDAGNALMIRLRVGDLNADAKHPDEYVTGYATGSSYSDILSAIRSDVVRRLTDLLPPIALPAS